MSISKAAGALNNALSQPDAKKARAQARTFFTYLRKMGDDITVLNDSLASSFNLYSMTAEEIKKMYALAEYDYPTVAVVEKVVVQAVAEKTVEKVNAKEVCFNLFAVSDMSTTAERNKVFNNLIEQYGFKKTVVQSYASNWKKALQSKAISV